MEESRRRNFAKADDLGDRDRQGLFAEIWKEYYPRIRLYLRAFSGLGEEDREEAAADTVLRAFEKARLYDPAKAFEPWLFCLARRIAFNRLAGDRRRDREASAGFDADRKPDTKRPGPEARLLGEEQRSLIAGYLGELPQKERELAFLVYGESMSLAQAAEVTGEPLGTVKWRLHALRKVMRSAMGREYA
jgi:RNA polymerase sigma-70 factor (ECF subfamily)